MALSCKPVCHYLCMLELSVGWIAAHLQLLCMTWNHMENMLKLGDGNLVYTWEDIDTLAHEENQWQAVSHNTCLINAELDDDKFGLDLIKK